MRSLYEKLGVTPEADLETIKKAHRRRVREVHPDKSGGCREKFQKVQHAYEVLSNPERRRRYDETGEASEVEDADRKALEILIQMWNQVLERFEPGEDLVALLRAAFKEGAESLNRQIDVAEKRKRRFQEMAARLRGDGILREVLDARIAELAGQQKDCADAIAAGAAAEKLIGEVKYRSGGHSSRMPRDSDPMSSLFEELRERQRRSGPGAFGGMF